MFKADFTENSTSTIKILHLLEEICNLYEKLCAVAPDQSTFKLLKGNLKEKKTNFEKVKELYEKITENILVKSLNSEARLISFEKGLLTLMETEINLLEMYREAYLEFKYEDFKDQIFEMIVDSIKHSLRLNTVYTKMK